MREHWHILGAGAMGCLFAAALRRAGCAITLLARAGDTAGAAAQVEIRVEGEGAVERFTLPASPAGARDPVRRLLICTKAYDVRAGIAGIAHRLGADCAVLLMVNGMGLLEELEADYPQWGFYAGTTTEGAYRLAPHRVRHAGAGATRIGREGETRPPPWFEAWRRALDDCAWDARIERALWRKLAVNCAINPLTAVHRCRNGALLERPELRSEARALCEEIAAACAAAGYRDIAGTLWENVVEVARATAGNRSSMLQDVLAGRRTEIAWINGYLLRVADSLGLDLPRNRALLQRLEGSAG